ncbi:hypothetical protein AY601_4410 [Pedobacter cryoconitis]|uniref:Glycosyl transferase family 10 (Putative fucosyltransferase) n=1 Tax=Pedobacter cryoconitis TaxID=188932 RepID=A0A127VJ75_9SPHI|nr:glycosyltransferase family 10 [Pedobacter cryoconitis]AMQ01251.1 hypothetical protein AY601_4410 [Pedobacter cryoconitis]
MKTTIRIKFQNGIDRSIAENEILTDLLDDFIFEETDNPDFILFGPYGNDIPLPGHYIRIGYFCENMTPDMEICEWAFGIPREQEILHPRYKRIQWHGLDPEILIKPDNYDAEQVYNSKSLFCNFLYSHKVYYREEFFKQLSKYKKVDAPGLSMNNMASIDKQYKGNIWERKRQFLHPYKFTIAFENYIYPGYQTEKLYDAMQANSVPIYFGDPFIGDIFNTKSFLNAPDHLNVVSNSTVNWLEKNSQPDFIDMRPQFYQNFNHRLKRKLKIAGRNAKMYLQFQKLNFKPIIEKIIELDQDKEAYMQLLNQQWLHPAPVNTSAKERWIEIFKQPI